MSLTIVTSPRFADHLNPPGHPECVDRFTAMQAVADEFRQRGGEVLTPRPAKATELERVHTPEYVSLIAETAGRAVALDPDTFTSPESFDVACLAAGAALGAVDHVLDSATLDSVASPGCPRRALALVRPPGHHAEANRAMGFCLFNNVAVAAAHARACGLSRVAIVDYDVHHGNGTQAMFYQDPAVLFVSSHQYPYYPGTGAAIETGAGPGQGFTVNLPMAAGATDADYALVYSRIVVPILRQFRPELILISAGFDAWKDDPLGGMRLTAGCFGRITRAIATVADECCGGRLVAVTEGGYDLAGLSSSLREVVHVLSTDDPPDGSADNELGADASRGRATIETVSPLLTSRWTL